MNFPFFYLPVYNASQQQIMLDEDTSRHIVQVLRMKKGGQLNLTDGKGTLITAEIAEDHKKHCLVHILSASNQQPAGRNITIAISLLKNTSRFEWFLEKAAEIGITEIIPLISNRTEKQKFRTDRMQNILVSAMLQSRQCWLPQLHQPAAFNEIIMQAQHQQKFIAHCADEARISLSDAINTSIASQIILIGPEGDFTPEEIAFALQHHFTPVMLGNTRLRTETAGVVAATLLKIE